VEKSVCVERCARYKNNLARMSDSSRNVIEKHTCTMHPVCNKGNYSGAAARNSYLHAI